MPKEKEWIKDTIVWRLAKAKFRPSEEDGVLPLLLTGGVICMGEWVGSSFYGYGIGRLKKDRVKAFALWTDPIKETK